MLLTGRVARRSVEPKIPDGSIGIFRGGEALTGTRQGRIVLVALRDSVDRETGGRLTVQRYHSEKAFDPDGQFTHTRITLHPLNPDFSPVVIEQQRPLVFKHSWTCCRFLSRQGRQRDS